MKLFRLVFFSSLALFSASRCFGPFIYTESKRKVFLDESVDACNARISTFPALDCLLQVTAVRANGNNANVKNSTNEVTSFCRLQLDDHIREFFFFLSAVSFLIWLLISSQRWNHVHLMKSLQFGVAFILLAVTFCLRFGLSYFDSFFMALKRLICQMIFIIKTTLIASFCRANNWHTLWLCASDTLFKLQFTRLRILWTSRLVVMESILRPALKTMIRKKTKHLQSISICNYVEWTFASWMAWKTIQLHSNLIWTKRFLLIVEKSLKEKVLFHFFFLCFIFFLLLMKVIIIAIVMWCLSLLCVIFFALFFFISKQNLNCVHWRIQVLASSFRGFC